MEFSPTTLSTHEIKTPCLVLGLFTGNRHAGLIKQIDEATGGWLQKQLKRGDFSGNKGQCQYLYDPPGLLAERLLLVGCGDSDDFGERAYFEACQNAAKTLNEGGAKQAVSCLPALKVGRHDLDWKLRQATYNSGIALYAFNEFKSKAEKVKAPLRNLALWIGPDEDITTAVESIRTGEALLSGITLARDLANRPGNICTPTHLAKQAKALKKQYARMSLEVLEEADMEKLGMGAFLSVSRGSEEPGKLIILNYQGGEKSARPIVLVGKGITFDTGGISLKPGAQMDEMKYDMGGAASVLGTLSACAQLELPLNVIGVIAAAENMPDGRASKPGDIVKTLSGQTVEILNTDAEGRLVLCDALSYVERFNPDSVVDMATLTGACIVALGHQVSAVLGNHPPLIQEIIQAGQTSFDRAWELPLFEEYQEQLKSNFADMANIGGRSAGTITAASFLARFTKTYHWAHLDIAGTAWVSGDKKGATGRPVGLLLQLLLDRVASAH
ncbi:leucyl aminopeptidase [Acidihalobacter yilgarnensis]|uniref:Probable cytosol aminopeptidase n=1 Tax=Acidihalobacter yilgarnensis TaxID=2819280 RepID=A0A1D8IPI8_9GAMM|nr:leucyl aminopeptidase [Acidihalobacter yilgarnensis]AOU98382.1 leucyl aminopeptidase [Acidihalobacter yilgarnensis]